MCSVNGHTIDIIRDESLPPQGTEADIGPSQDMDNKSCTWKSIISKYFKRDVVFNSMNLYHFASLVFLNKSIIPQFVEYPN